MKALVINLCQNVSDVLKISLCITNDCHMFLCDYQWCHQVLGWLNKYPSVISKLGEKKTKHQGHKSQRVNINVIWKCLTQGTFIPLTGPFILYRSKVSQKVEICRQTDLKYAKLFPSGLIEISINFIINTF